MKKIAILGYGGRGRIYALHVKYMSTDARVVAVIDCNLDKLRVAAAENGLPEEALFSDLDDFLTRKNGAETLFICTQDRDHIEHAMKAIEAGFKDILLEKPISPDIRDCLALRKKAEENGVSIAVCHVLRYTRFYRRVKQIIDSGALGRLISVEMNENVGYWHQAHSFVRGDWRSKETSAPMILAKCCHDLDLAVFLTGQRCAKLSSVGELNHFKRSEEPAVCADRCVDCANTECPYDARKLYLDRFRKFPLFARPFAWPMTRLVSDSRPTVKKLEAALREGQFGKCVYRTDNDVVDYEDTTMYMENGVHCNLIMTAFSYKPYRTITVRGTLGTLEGHFERCRLVLRVFGKRKKTIQMRPGLFGHGGGDKGLVDAVVRGTVSTTIAESIESHLMAHAAEQSRLAGGEFVDIRRTFEE